MHRRVDRRATAAAASVSSTPLVASKFIVHPPIPFPRGPRRPTESRLHVFFRIVLFSSVALGNRSNNIVQILPVGVDFHILADGQWTDPGNSPGQLDAAGLVWRATAFRDSRSFSWW